jgi:hypothetical protein
MRKRKLGRCRRTICIAIVSSLLVLLGDSARFAQAADEYTVKAAMLFNFSQFVEWPTNAFSEAKSPLIIGVLGDDPFNGGLDRILANKSAGTHPIVAVHFSNVSEISRCHILFIAASSQGQLSAAQQKLNGASVLTVGETEDFATSAGGVARLYTEEGHIRVEINRTTAGKANLHISAKLLKLARIVQ